MQSTNAEKNTLAPPSDQRLRAVSTEFVQLGAKRGPNHKIVSIRRDDKPDTGEESPAAVVEGGSNEDPAPAISVSRKLSREVVRWAQKATTPRRPSNGVYDPSTFTVPSPMGPVSLNAPVETLPNGFYRTVRSQRAYNDMMDDRLKSYVVIELVNGHQIIRNWTCGELVTYVTSLAHEEEMRRNAQESSSGERHTQQKKESSTSRLDSKTRQTAEIQAMTQVDGNVVHTGATVRSPGPAPTIIYHYHYYGGGHSKSSMAESRYRTPVLSYRDVRQVFTDGSPVASIEVRKHCIVMCLPPLSCIIMADRFFLLVVEEVESEALISSIRHAQVVRGPETIFGRKVSSSNSPGEKASSLPFPEREKNSTGSRRSSEDLAVPMFVSGRLSQNTASTQHSDPQASVGRSLSFNHTLPFEFEAFEVIVAGAFKQLDKDVSQLEREFLQQWPIIIVPTPHSSEVLHGLKNCIRVYQDRVALFDKALDKLTKDESAMEELDLSTHFTNSDENRKASRMHLASEMVVLLEFFDQELEIFRQRLLRMSEKLESRDRINHMRMHMNRYQMARWEVMGSLLGAGFGLCGAIGGVFGMNLVNSWEDSHTAFLYTVGILIFLFCMTNLGSWYFMRRSALRSKAMLI